MGFCNYFMFCCTLLYVHSSIAVILMRKRELVAFLGLSSWCLMMVERLFLALSWGCLWFVIVVFPDHTHYQFLKKNGRITEITLDRALSSRKHGPYHTKFLRNSLKNLHRFCEPDIS